MAYKQLGVVPAVDPDTATKEYVDEVDGGTSGSALKTIQPRRGTAAEWTSANPVLAEGELGWESDTGFSKRGNGSDQWADLGYSKPDVMPSYTVSTYYGGTLGADDDTACIQATMDAANAAGGGLVVIPPRTDGYVYKYEQLIIPRYIHLTGIGWHSAGATGITTRMQQLSGVNDDSIIFNDNDDVSSRPYIGPFGITDLVIRGAAGSTGGHGINFRVPDGRIAGMQDFSTLERVMVRGFAGSGIYLPKGSPIRLSDINGLWNGRYAVEVEDTQVDTSSGSVHTVMLKHISGDGNMGGVSDGGGATVLLKGLQATKASVVMVDIKSEYRIRGINDSGDGTVMGNFNAVVIENCGCPIAIHGVEHIATGTQTRLPGNAIQITGAARPNLSWTGVNFRSGVTGQTTGSTPCRVYDAVNAVERNAPAGFLGDNRFYAEYLETTTIRDANGNRTLTLSPEASAVNYLTIGNAATGSSPSLTASGTDTDVDILLVPRGAGRVKANGAPVSRRNIQTVTSSTTLNANGDYVVFIGASGAPTLPTAGSGNQGRYTFKNVTTTDRTIATTSSQTIDGATTYTLAPGAAVEVVSDGSNWRIFNTDTTFGNELASGEATMRRREVIAANLATSNGALRLTYFTATKTETISSVRTFTGSTAAVTPGLCRVGIYSVASNGDLTLVASTANDTALWGGTSTTYTKALSASFSKVRGTRYAVGTLIVDSATAPTHLGNLSLLADEAALSPRLCAAKFSQTDLPPSVTAGTLATTTLQYYSALAP